MNKFDNYCNCNYTNGQHWPNLKQFVAIVVEFTPTTSGMGSGCVAQLVERSLQIPEVRGSNPFIGKILLNICLLSTVYWKDENKEKEAGNGPFKKNKWRQMKQATFINIIMNQAPDFLARV